MTTKQITEIPKRPAREFDWDGGNMVLRTMICRLHPACRYLTKHYHDRSWHYVGTVPECECSPEELVVLTDADEIAAWN